MLAPAPPMVQPLYAHIPEPAWTYGDKVADLCAQAHYAPEPEQRLALNAIFGRDERGKSVAREIWILGPRQNIKTSVMKQAALGWGFLDGEDPIIWTAHEWDPVLHETFLELEELIGGWSWLSRQVRYLHRGRRQIEMGLKNGARFLFKTRTLGGARGIAGAKTILDEGWAIKPGHVGALIPTMSARSITGDPQVLGGSSGAREDSAYLHDVITRGRAAATDPAVAALEPSLVYIEYGCAEPKDACDLGDRCDHGKQTAGCGCDKPEVIRAGNPAIGRRISMEFVAWERRTLPVEEYCRERMNWHERPPGAAKVIPLTDWAAALDVASEPAGPVMMAVVYASDKRSAALGLAGLRADRLWHVEVADDIRPSWVGVRARSVMARSELEGVRPVRQPVAVDGAGFEKECIPSLEGELTFEDARKIAEGAGMPWDEAWEPHWPERVTVRKMTAGDVVAAYTGFFKSVTDARDLRHRGQDELTLALVGATARDVGDAGEAWGRKKSGVDIKYLVAVTEARWLFEQECPVMDAEPGAWSV